jgi:hypothetical protein
MAVQIAQVYAPRNDAKATFEWLDRAWSNRDTGIEFMLFDPFSRRLLPQGRRAGAGGRQSSGLIRVIQALGRQRLDVDGLREYADPDPVNS